MVLFSGSPAGNMLDAYSVGYLLFPLVVHAVVGWRLGVVYSKVVSPCAYFGGYKLASSVGFLCPWFRFSFIYAAVFFGRFPELCFLTFSFLQAVFAFLNFHRLKFRLDRIFI